MLKLYGHYGSQPFRSVAWLLKMKKEPFEFITINPIKGDHRTADYRAKFPLGLIPAIEDDPGDGKTLAMSEAAAIMIYLCEKHKWNEWYPSSNIRQRALINEYFSHHNESTRLMTGKVIRPGLSALFAAEGNLSPGLAQIPQILGIDYSEWPELEELRQWLDRMAKLPYHDDVHRTATKLGKLYQSKL